MNVPTPNLQQYQFIYQTLLKDFVLLARSPEVKISIVFFVLFRSLAPPDGVPQVRHWLQGW